ncbi:hypothetical protein QFC22_006078 [Naganishia vaughanmartiniae]|uniref:Uncharacterized protein n=1 Tax=Naganishia vaughanmartiniae TaxID=1424756 RepID=A0ACC2WPV1_9TREE|nr:hypothetical protein QFC22_006078 [Naganishia vaughanmartiniae]
MASIMAVESSGDVETNLSSVDKKYDLIRRLAQTGISYVLVARDPARISRRGLLSRARRKRKTTVDEEKLVKPTFHLNMDYEALVFSIFEENIIPFFPAVSYQELDKIRSASANIIQSPTTGSSLPPIAGLIICTLSALNRTIPRQIFQELSHALYLKFETIEGLRVLSISSLAHIQVLLLLTMNPETQSPATNHSGSMTFLRIGTAIRMAQDLVNPLGCNVENSASDEELSLGPASMFERAGYTGCTTCATAEGMGRPGSAREMEPSNLFLTYLSRLSLMLSQILFILYTPSARIENFDHVEFIRLRTEVLHWPNTLPPQLAFTPDTTSTRSGELLRVFYIPLVLLLFRPWLPLGRTSFATFQAYEVTPEEWDVLVRHSQRAIDWLSVHGAPILDIWWFVVVIGFVWSALMQFYAAWLNDDVVALSYLGRAMYLAISWAQPADSHIEDDGHSDGEFRLKIVTLLELMHQVAHRRIRLSQATRSQNGLIHLGAAPFAIPESSGMVFYFATLELERFTRYHLIERTAPFALATDSPVQNAGPSYAIPNLSATDQFDWPLADFSLEGNASSEEFWSSMISLMEDTLF